MREPGFPKTSPERNKTPSAVSKELLELVGGGTADSLPLVLSRLHKTIDALPVTGKTLAGREQHSKSLILPVVSSEERTLLLSDLAELKIFPYEEEGHLIVEREDDLKKLVLAGIISASVLGRAPIDETPAQTPALHQFPLRSVEGSESPLAFLKRGAHRSPRENSGTEEDIVDEDSGIDTEIKALVDTWDQGLMDEDDREFQSTFGLLPNLKLFPRKYMWKGGRCFDKATNREVTEDDRTELRVLAKNGDEKAMQTLLGMHAGLVLYKLALLRKRFSIADADTDDLFQEGLLGLVRAIEKYEEAPEEERRAAFTTYAGIWIESRMRRSLVNDRRLVRLPAHTYEQRNRYFRAVNEVQREYPELSETDPIFEEQVKKKLVAYGVLDTSNDRDENGRPIDPLDQFKRTFHIDTHFVPLEEVKSGDVSEVDMMGESTSTDGGLDAYVSHAKLREYIAEVLTSLNLRERLVLCMRFGIIPEEKLRKQFYAELCRRVRDARNISEYSRRLMAEVESYNPDHFDSFAFREKPAMEKFLYAFSGKVPKEEFDGMENTLEETGYFMGLTRGRIRQIEAKALQNIKHPVRSKKLRGFVED